MPKTKSPSKPIKKTASRRARRLFPEEVQRAAVMRVRSGESPGAVAEDLDVGSSLLAYWRKKFKAMPTAVNVEVKRKPGRPPGSKNKVNGTNGTNGHAVPSAPRAGRKDELSLMAAMPVVQAVSTIQNEVSKFLGSSTLTKSAVKHFTDQVNGALRSIDID